jgi:hypothetical protein
MWIGWGNGSVAWSGTWWSSEPRSWTCGSRLTSHGAATSWAAQESSSSESLPLGGSPRGGGFGVDDLAHIQEVYAASYRRLVGQLVGVVGSTPRPRTS